jgi:hypothetical protein
MPASSGTPNSLLRKLSVNPGASVFPAVRYDRRCQTAQVYDGGEWTDSWLVPSLRGTKKRDIETGEDAKGQ